MDVEGVVVETTLAKDDAKSAIARAETIGDNCGHDVAIDPVEVALATALARAAEAQQWELVGQLAKELKARRRQRTRWASASDQLMSLRESTK